MIKAILDDKDLVVNILANAFADNKSVNYIVRQDNKLIERIKYLMNYSFETCMLFGAVYLSDDKNGCALIIYPEKKKINLKSVLLDLQLIFKTTGFANIKKAVKREAVIQRHHPKDLLCYLWFIGVTSSEQHKGTGSQLMNEIISEATAQKRIICLETSTLQNIPWYQKFGFTIYSEFDFGYRLYCLKRELLK